MCVNLLNNILYNLQFVCKFKLQINFQPKIDVFWTISIGKKNKPSINQKSENEQTPNPSL